MYSPVDSSLQQNNDTKAIGDSHNYKNQENVMKTYQKYNSNNNPSTKNPTQGGNNKLKRDKDCCIY